MGECCSIISPVELNPDDNISDDGIGKLMCSITSGSSMQSVCIPPFTVYDQQILIFRILSHPTIMVLVPVNIIKKKKT